MNPRAEIIPSIKISALAHDGRGIGFLPGGGSSGGKAVFVSGALPGQTVSCRVTADKKNYLSAALLTPLEPAPDQVDPVCAHCGQCGGCPLQTMPYSAQMEWKERLVKDSMTRLGGISEKEFADVWQKPIPAASLKYFRNKTEMAFGKNEAGHLALGFRRRASHAVLDAPDCVLMPPLSRQMAKDCRDFAARSDLPPYQTGDGFWRFLILRQGLVSESMAPGWFAICVTSPASDRERKIVADMGRNLLAKYPDLAAFIHEERKRRDAFAQGEKRILCLDENGRENSKAAEMTMRLANRNFVLDAAGFFQVSTESARQLANLVVGIDDMIEHSPKGNLLDAYCGVGAPGLLLAPRYREVLGLEQDRTAAKYARRNASGYGHCRYLSGDAARLAANLAKEKNAWTTALLDPPRAGLSTGFREALTRLAPDNVIYVSCNSVTMARDYRSMSSLYRLEKLTGVDMFPHTPGLECCGLWKKRPATKKDIYI